MNKIIHGDSLVELAKLADNSVDSIITDPPYELSFMAKTWDGTGIAYNIKLWQECLRVLKHGGHLAAFGGTRTHHRMVCAIEDAGFEIRDEIAWIYGSGFPKSLNIGKAIDKTEGNEREVVGGYIHSGSRQSGIMGKDLGQIWHENTKGNSKYEGYGTALKPAIEPICIARKPLSEPTVAKNVLKWGTGGINIDGCRVKMEQNDREAYIDKQNTFRNKEHADAIYGVSSYKMPFPEGIVDIKINNSTLGRFPANVILDDSDCVEEEFAKYGQSSSSSYRPPDAGGTGNTLTFKHDTGEHRGHNDTGTVSRYFKHCEADAPFFYSAKASQKERNMGCEELELKLKIGYSYTDEPNDPANGMFKDRDTKSFNHHPTVKPLSLMKYLITMFTPPQGIVLDPFAGSGSTLVAAKQLGFDFIGIELTAEYIPIINARLNAVEDKLL